MLKVGFPVPLSVELDVPDAATVLEKYASVFALRKNCADLVLHRRTTESLFYSLRFIQVRFLISQHKHDP